MTTIGGRRVVGVRFKRAGKVYYFDPGDVSLQVHDRVVVETEKGLELGTVVIAPGQLIHSDIKEPLKPILRKATAEDEARKEELRGKEREALVMAGLKGQTLGLPLKVVDAEYTLSGDRLMLLYITEEKGDFRPLIRTLSDYLHVKVELHQVGARDGAKVVGGLGRCGLALCCAMWLARFEPVTMKMAKEQHLPPTEDYLTGQCGRLKCCLRYEYEHYVALNKALPKIGERVTTPHGIAKVVVGHVLKQSVSVSLGETGAVLELPLAQISRLEAKKE